MPTRPATLKYIRAQQLTKMVAYGRTHTEALNELRKICVNYELPPIMLLPGREKYGECYCGVIKHPSIFSDEWLFNTVFFGTDRKTGKKCAWFYWNLTRKTENERA